MVKKQYIQKMSIAEMRMLRWMNSVELKNRVKNENIGRKLEVASTENKMRDNRLRWFSHVHRRLIHSIIRRIDSL